MGTSGTGHRGTLIWWEKSLFVEKIDAGLGPPLPSPVNTLCSDGDFTQTDPSLLQQAPGIGPLSLS